MIFISSLYYQSFNFSSSFFLQFWQLVLLCPQTSHLCVQRVHNDLLVLDLITNFTDLFQSLFLRLSIPDCRSALSPRPFFASHSAIWQSSLGICSKKAILIQSSALNEIPVNPGSSCPLPLSQQGTGAFSLLLEHLSPFEAFESHRWLFLINNSINLNYPHCTVCWWQLALVPAVCSVSLSILPRDKLNSIFQSCIASFPSPTIQYRHKITWQRGISQDFLNTFSCMGVARIISWFSLSLILAIVLAQSEMLFIPKLVFIFLQNALSTSSTQIIFLNEYLFQFPLCVFENKTISN